MKSGTDSKLKFKQLQRRLKLALWEARGLLDTLWSFTSSNAPDGGIGRYSDEEIAIGIDWDRTEPEELIAVLVATRWLDERPGPRLVVHDWPEHCESTVQNAIARKIGVFADGTIPKFTRLDKEERTQIIRAYEDRYGSEAVENKRAFPDALSTPEGSPSPSLPFQALPFPSPPSQADAPPTPSKEEGEVSWKLVSKELKAAGVNDAASAAKDAQANGLAPQDVLDLITHYRASPGAWNAGALHYRVRTGSPGIAAADNWPPPAKAYVDKTKEREATAARQQEQEQQEQVATAARNADSKLEKDFGERLDSMDEAAVFKLLNGHTLIVERLKKHGRKSKLVRDALLTELARQEGSSP